MGSRANLIIITGDNEYELYYCHWCANSLTREFFWGPEHAIAYIRQQERSDTNNKRSWLNETWAEGGAVIDPIRRVLLLFGNIDILYDVPLRRLYLKMLEQMWQNWDLRWAYEGIAEQADYVGLPRTVVLSSQQDERRDDLPLAPPIEKDWADGVGSIRWEDGSLRFYPIANGAACYLYLYQGSGLLEAAKQEVGLETLYLDEWTEDFPSGGFHIDVAKKTIELWLAPDAADVEKRIAQFWPPEWSVIWHQDRYEFQIERADNRLRFPVPSLPRMKAKLRGSLLHVEEQEGLEAVISIREQIFEQAINNLRLG